MTGRTAPSVLALALAFAPGLPAAAPPAARGAEETPAATYAGRPVSRADLHDALARRVLRTENGPAVLDQYLSDVVTEAERRRRGIEVDEARVDEFVARTAKDALEQMRRHGQGGPDTTFEQVLEERGATMEEFRRQARQYLGLQEMARVDLGASGEVSPAQIDLWIRDLKKRSTVVTDRPSLAPGTVARVGDAPVTAGEFGRWLSVHRPRHEVYGVIVDLAFEQAVALRAERTGTTLPEGAAVAEVARLEKEFQDQPGIAEAGIDFRSWLDKAQGLTPETLARDRPFVANLLARRIVDAELTDAQVADEYERDPAPWGQSARVRRIILRGSSGESAFGPGKRSMAEARRLAARVIDLCEGGKEFGEVARSLSDDPEAARGRPFDVTPEMNSTILPPAVLEAVFETPAGRIVGPVESADVLWIVRVDRRTPAPSREEALVRVRTELVARRVGLWRIDLRSSEELVVAPEFRVPDGK